MRRITILLILAALLAAPASALSIKKKSIRKLSQDPQITTLKSTTDFEKAVEAYEKDDYETAEEYMSKHLKKNPNHITGWAYMSAIYSEDGYPNDALEAIDRARNLITNEEDTELLNWIYFTRSTIHMQLKQPEKAIEDLTLALKYDPKDVDSYFRRANIYHKQLKKYDLAMVDYGMVIQYEPKEVDGYLGLGAVAGSLEKRKDAIKAFTKAIALSPNEAEPYALRAVEYYNDWDYKKSAEDVISALEREPDNNRALWVLGYLKTNEDAIKDVTKVFKNKAKKSNDSSWLDLLKKDK